LIFIQNIEFNSDGSKGHAGHPENERCDKLARMAALRPTEIDTEYEMNQD